MSRRTENIVYAPLGMLLHAIARLPFGTLYMLSDVIYFIVYHLLGYRKRVVWNNLRESFPDKSDAEVKKVMSDFYRFFADYFVETIKLLHISDDEMRRRFVFHNIELIDRCFDEKRSIVIYAAHYGNWEWLPSVTLWSRHDFSNDVFAQVYRPLKNEWFDAFFLKLRSRFHSLSFTKKSVFRDLIRLKRDGKLSITGFMSDQHPSLNDDGYLTRFMNHDTAMITGTETLARRLDFAVLYFEITRQKRGYYDCTIREVALNPKNEPHGSITERYTRMLEAQIQRQPELWLWTHKRWKHKVTLNQNKESDDNGND